MTWQLGSFAILTLALAGGFAWYERTRPDARIVALVGTLAAFAALGRIAFAALPNVKPTTDIVLISGYALGGAPGFVVGALAGLTSNFFFGQGPWTPWQMAAWGATGMLGAGLAVLTARRIARWPLAVVCAVVGFAFAAVQDVGDWVTYSDHSAAQLRVYVGKGVGFDVVHAVGCFAFALAFGPPLTRSIQRFAARLNVTWRTLGGALVPAILAITALSLAAGLGAPAPARAAGTPEGYLLAAQQPDGGFGPSPAGPSYELYSGWAALGLAAAGQNPQDVSRDGHSLLSYVQDGAGSLSDVGALERTILVARAAGVSPRSFGGRDLLAALQRDVRPDGSVWDQVNLTSFAVLALRAASVAPAARTRSWLVHQQSSDGGFSFATAGGGSDVDDTGAALEALGPGRSAVHAVSFLRRQQNPDGGFPSEPGGPSNAQSTAWAVQGLLAAGVNPDSLHHSGAVSPLAFLRSLIGSDGHLLYSRGTDQTPVWVTAQALMALALEPLPLGPVPRRAAADRGGSAGTGSATTANRTGARARARARAVRRVGAGAGARAGAGTGATASGAGRRLARVRPRAGPALVSLAADAALVTALVFAPVGLG
jgi:energy-coupling factor transport system substrate-specific component